MIRMWFALCESYDSRNRKFANLRIIWFAHLRIMRIIWLARLAFKCDCASHASQWFAQLRIMRIIWIAILALTRVMRIIWFAWLALMWVMRINDSHDSQYCESCESLIRMIRRYMRIMRIKIFAQQNNRSESHANHMIRSTLILLTFWSLIYCIFDAIYACCPNMGITAWCFSWKIWKKMTWEHSLCEKIEVFMIKYGYESSMFFKRMDVFYTNYGYEST